MKQETELLIANCRAGLTNLGKILETNSFENRGLEAIIDNLTADLSNFESNNPDSNLLLGTNILHRIKLTLDISQLILKNEDQLEKFYGVIEKIYASEYKTIKFTIWDNLKHRLDFIEIETSVQQLKDIKNLEAEITENMVEVRRMLSIQNAYQTYQVEVGLVHDVKLQQQLRTDFQKLYKEARVKFGDTCETTIEHLKEGKEIIKNIDENMRFEAALQQAQQQIQLTQQKKNSAVTNGVSKQTVSCCMFMFKGSNAFDSADAYALATKNVPSTPTLTNQPVQSHRPSFTSAISLRKFSLQGENGANTPTRIRDRLARLHGLLAKLYAEAIFEFDTFEYPPRSNNTTPVPTYDFAM